MPCTMRAVCAGGLLCSTGACAASCSGGKTACGGGCVNLGSDPDNCSACGKACAGGPNGVATCAGATCGVKCNAGYRACGGACKAESATSCGAACAVCNAPVHGVALCNGGACGFTCEAGYVPEGGACVEDVVVGDDPRVSAGESHSCGVRTDGSVACWGDNTSWSNHRARRCLSPSQRGRLSQLRREGGRIRRLLGGK